METHELFLQNGWRFETFRPATGHVVIWDGARQKLLKIPLFLFKKLEENNFYNKPLEEALQRALAEKNWRTPKAALRRLPHQIFLRLLGNRVLVRCTHKQCSEEIEHYFSSSLEEAKASADLIVDCEWEQAGMALFTHRVAETADPVLKGVQVYTAGGTDAQDWPYLSAPIPPMEVYPFKDQFAGLHAAMVQTGEGKGLLLAGAEGSGKTTLAAELTNRHGCRFLTDDVVYIHKRTRLAEPFAQPLKFRTPGSGEKLVPAREACREIAREAVLITHIVYLERSAAQSGFERLQPDACLESVLPFHQNLGCNMDESIATLFGLAANAAAARFRYRQHEELLNACAHLLAFTQGHAPVL